MSSVCCTDVSLFPPTMSHHHHRLRPSCLPPPPATDLFPLPWLGLQIHSSTSPPSLPTGPSPAKPRGTGAILSGLEATLACLASSVLARLGAAGCILPGPSPWCAPLRSSWRPVRVPSWPAPAADGVDLLLALPVGPHARRQASALKFGFVAVVSQRHRSIPTGVVCWTCSPFPRNFDRLFFGRPCRS